MGCFVWQRMNSRIEHTTSISAFAEDDNKWLSAPATYIDAPGPTDDLVMKISPEKDWTAECVKQ